MTVTLTKVPWGVRHAGALDRTDHVDVRQDKADAAQWQQALRFCGNADAELVWRRPDGSWAPVAS